MVFSYFEIRFYFLLIIVVSHPFFLLSCISFTRVLTRFYNFAVFISWHCLIYLDWLQFIFLSSNLKFKAPLFPFCSVRWSYGSYLPRGRKVWSAPSSSPSTPWIHLKLEIRKNERQNCLYETDCISLALIQFKPNQPNACGLSWCDICHISEIGCLGEMFLLSCNSFSYQGLSLNPQTEVQERHCFPSILQLEQWVPAMWTLSFTCLHANLRCGKYMGSVPCPSRATGRLV